MNTSAQFTNRKIAPEVVLSEEASVVVLATNFVFYPMVVAVDRVNDRCQIVFGESAGCRVQLAQLVAEFRQIRIGA